MSCVYVCICEFHHCKYSASLASLNNISSNGRHVCNGETREYTHSQNTSTKIIAIHGDRHHSLNCHKTRTISPRKIAWFVFTIFMFNLQKTELFEIQLSTWALNWFLDREQNVFEMVRNRQGGRKKSKTPKEVKVASKAYTKGIRVQPKIGSNYVGDQIGT